MASPVVHPLVQEAYESLGPWARADEDVWDLLWLTFAVFQQLAEIDDLVRDSDTHVGWGKLLDVDTCPAWALPWLAQFVGVQTIPNLDDASQRIRIKKAAGWNRGTPGAIIAAAQQYLTGSRRVDLFERDGGNPWRFRVRTYASETPNAQAVYDAVNALKPAGLLFVHEVQAGLTVDQLTGTVDQLTGTVDSYSNIVPT